MKTAKIVTTEHIQQHYEADGKAYWYILVAFGEEGAALRLGPFTTPGKAEAALATYFQAE